jgi:hypothetical protein
VQACIVSEGDAMQMKHEREYLNKSVGKTINFLDSPP